MSAEEIKKRLEEIEIYPWNDDLNDDTGWVDSKDAEWLITQLRKALEREASLQVLIKNLEGHLGHPVTNAMKLVECKENVLAQFIAKERDKLRADLQIAVEALEYYADPEIYEETQRLSGEISIGVMKNNGFTAKQALSKIRGEGK